MSKNVEKRLSAAELADGMKRFESIFRSGVGYDYVTEKSLTIKDALDLPNAAFMIPRVLTQIVQMGIEPYLIGASLLQKIPYQPGMTAVFPAVDILEAREVGDGASLPIFNVNVGGATQIGVTVKRHGLMLKVADRFIEESNYPWLNMWLQLASNALARHKESLIFNFITQLGTIAFDNDATARATGSPAQYKPLLGVTTGRDSKGTYNGSMTVDDIFDMYAQVLAQGFTPDTLLVHPMAWLMWVKDPTLREFAIQAGGGSFFANWTGNAAAQNNPFFNFNGLGAGAGQNPSNAKSGVDLPQNQTSAPVIPNYLGLPFRILVSPFVRFDPVTRQTDMMMFQSSNLGALIVKEEPVVRSWEDTEYSITKMAIEETYGFGVLHEGQSIAVAKNIKVRPNEFILPARSIIDLSTASGYETKSSITEFGASPTNVLD